MKSVPLEQRFWNKVAIAGPDDCWEWQASRKANGYGQIGAGTGGTLNAHRLAYILTKGEIPNGLCVCHSCDNPPCCNPAHLWLGTHQDNMRDMVSKSRANGNISGNWVGHAKYTPVHLPFMRVMMFVHDKSVVKIAAETKLDIEIVRDFTRGKFFQLDIAEKIAICLRTDIAKLLAPGDVVFSVEGYSGSRIIQRQTPGYIRYHPEALSPNGHTEPESVTA